ncbi:hypothetical protein [Stenotrophomonas sp. S39]|uniref:hypothetical protein n=1 Tax=Stenotrophomonas sp. S39 TaxID=2767451 RepID=UPI00190DF1DB|nr:hypothetical protein [Stenotrophomonas sp. S39]MBK0053785.1 hypothetical protein [Stenotrophomonas sp. S39]
MERKIANEIFDVTIVDENGNRTKRSVSQKKAGFTVTIKPASASEKRLGMATRAIHKQRRGLKAIPGEGGFLNPDAKRAKPLT